MTSLPKINISTIRKEIIAELENISAKPKKAETAEDFSNGFLLVKSYLSDQLEIAETLAGSLKGIEKAQYSEAVMNSDEKAISGKEYVANTNKDYLNTHELRISAEAACTWLKTHIDIFNDAAHNFRKKAERLSGR